MGAIPGPITVTCRSSVAWCPPHLGWADGLSLGARVMYVPLRTAPEASGKKKRSTFLSFCQRSSFSFQPHFFLRSQAGSPVLPHLPALCWAHSRWEDGKQTMHQTAQRGETRLTSIAEHPRARTRQLGKACRYAFCSSPTNSMNYTLLPLQYICNEANCSLCTSWRQKTLATLNIFIG